LLLVCVKSFAQNVSLPDLVALQATPAQEIKDYFIEAGWKLVDERFSEKRGFGDMMFATTDGSPMTATVYYGQGKPSQTRFVLKMKSREQFSVLKSGIDQAGLRFHSTNTAANLTTTVFKSEHLTLRIIGTRPVGGEAAFEFQLESNGYDPKMYQFSLGQ